MLSRGDDFRSTGIYLWSLKWNKLALGQLIEGQVRCPLPSWGF